MSYIEKPIYIIDGVIYTEEGEEFSMVTRKDFNLAAIRIFCDMIVADGLVVGSELAEFEKWQKDYGLIGDTLADEKVIQEAHGVTLGKAIENINAYNIAMIKAGNCTVKRGMCEDVCLFLNRLKSIALADGECSPNEARLLLAVNYVVQKKDGLVFSIPADRLRLSSKEILMLEGDMSDTSFIRQLYLKSKNIQGCSLDFAGWKSVNVDKKNISEENNFCDYIREKHSAIIKELDYNRELYQYKFSTYGFDFIDVRSSLAQLLDITINNGELLGSAIKLVNPASRYGVDLGCIKTVLQGVKPSDITNSLFHGCDFKYIAPSLLVKISNSINWTPEGKVGKYTDLLLINIKGFARKETFENFDNKNRLLLTTIDELLDNYIEPMGRFTHTVSVNRGKAFHVHGFHNTLLAYAIQKVGNNKGVEYVRFDIMTRSVIFKYRDRSPISLTFKRAPFFIYYLLLMCSQRIPKRKISLDFIDYDGRKEKKEVENYKQRNQKFYNIFVSYNKLYRAYVDSKEVNIYKVKNRSTDQMQIFHGQVISEFNRHSALKGDVKFVPSIDVEGGCYYLDTSEYRNLVFVKDLSGETVRIDDWIALKKLL